MAIADTPARNADVYSWAGAIRQRRKALPQRLAMAAAAGLVFSTIIGWSAVLTWALVYLLVQIVDHFIFLPITRDGRDSPGPLLAVAGGGIVFANAASFGWVSIPLWQSAGTAGGVCAAVLLGGAAIYSVINSPGSPRALACALAPQLFYLALTPMFLARSGASANVVSAAAVAVVAYGYYCLNTWSMMDKARRAEIAARVEADRKRADAERVMASRAAFLATVGHDLRTPISAILTGSAELERGAVDGAQRAQSRLISDAGLMMKDLLDDLLDHARLEAGHLTVEESDFNLRELLSQTLRLWQGPARSKGLRLRVEGAATIPAGVRGDPMRLRQVLNNLISNAMKFTDEGAVTLHLKAWREADRRHALVIEVADTGPGMSPEQMTRLFNPFDQTADGVSARHGGSGLGLSISRQMVELMGGRLTARSRVGQGSQFTLALTLPDAHAAPAADMSLDRDARAAAARSLGVSPVADLRSAAADVATLSPAPVETVQPQPVQPEPVSPEPEPAAEADESRPMRVLVVDDHDINRRAIQLILQPLGCDIATAADGLAALRICEAEAFDLIFMDVRMPELDGRETTRRLRAMPGPNAATPVIAVTADTSPEDIAACTAAGMTYFVPKPITPPMLFGAVNHVLMGAEADQGATAAA